MAELALGFSTGVTPESRLNEGSQITEHAAVAVIANPLDHFTERRSWETCLGQARFMYNTATTMVHEMGHIFIPFLNGGESNTPPSKPGDEGFVHGEGGREMETILFGGYPVILICQDHRKKASWSGWSRQAFLTQCSKSKSGCIRSTLFYQNQFDQPCPW